MGIKGLTDRGMSFPEIGQIRKGAPKPENGRGPGRDLDYFRAEFAENEDKAENVFVKVYGQEPHQLNILLPFDEIDRVWDAWLEAYTAGRMVARSDGEKFIYLVDTKTGEVLVRDGQPYKKYEPEKPAGTYTDGKGKEQPIFCKPTGRLKVVIPELQRLAYMTVLTTSVNDIANLSQQLEALKEINGGKLSGLPMVLKRRPKKISTPKPDGSRARYTKYMLSIEADPDWVRKKLVDVKRAALPGNGLDLLGDGDDDHDEEVVDVEYEEHPEQIVKESDLKEQHNAEDVNKRPYPPEIVSERVKARIAYHEEKGGKASNRQRGLLVGVLESCFAGSQAEIMRKGTTFYLTGKGSSKELTDAEVLALLDWLGAEKDTGGQYTACKEAQQEAIKIVEFQEVKQGQEGLF